MPYAKEKHREYMLKRYHARRQRAILYLGSACAYCTSENQLEIDHIDPTQKTFSVAKMWNVAEKRFLDEIKKCQLLCKPCHIKKSIQERGFSPAKGTHGRLSSYKYCGPPKCELCKKAKRDWTRENKQKKK